MMFLSNVIYMDYSNQIKYFTTWLDLTADAAYKYLDKLIESIQGHLKYTFQNIRSTKSPSPFKDSSEEARVRTQLVLTKPIIIIREIYIDQTGQFPFQSNLGTQYFMICYDYNSKTIVCLSHYSHEGGQHYSKYI